MRIKELNESEPLMKSRNYDYYAKTEGNWLLQDNSQANLLSVVRAYGVKMARTWYRLLYGTWEAVILMLREKLKWKTHKSESTEAEYSGGVVCHLITLITTNLRAKSF